MFHPKGPTFLELARQALSSTEQGYDLLAPKFDYTPFRTPDKILQPIFHLLGEPVGAGLDICCGTGAAMHFLKPLCKKRLVGLDTSQGMMDQAKNRFTQDPESPIPEWVRGDALDLPFSNEFDLATCFGALGHIPEDRQEAFVDGVARALRPGGRFVFVTSRKAPAGSRELWFARLFNAGIRVRNWVWPGEFIMYYLTFLLPECETLLKKKGFSVQVMEDVFTGPTAVLKPVIATWPGHG